MNLQLENQRVAVFGAASGMGKAVADAFRREGARVFGADLAETGEPFSARVDVADFSAVKAFVDRVAGEWGGIDHAVCAAAKGSGKFGFPFWNLDPGDWKNVLDVSLVGSVNVATAVQPWLCKADSSASKSLLFFTSVAGQIGSQTDPPYSAAKAGIINFTQCAAKDFAPYGVRVNALSPGMVKTPLNRAVWAAWRPLAWGLPASMVTT